MAKMYPSFRLAEKIGKNMVEIDAPTVEKLIELGSQVVGEDLSAEVKKFAILVNGRNIRYLEGFKTPLSDDDEVFFVGGSGGG